jgi:hypothetical protein
MCFFLLMTPQFTWRCPVSSGGFEDHDPFMEAKSKTKPPEVVGFRRFVGGAEQDRTVDLLIANARLRDKAASGGTWHHQNN